MMETNMGEQKRRRDYEQAHPEESRFHKMASAQDAFTQLVEDCRVGTLERITFDLDGPSYTPYKPDLDLSHVPVFFLGNVPLQVPEAVIDAGDAVIAGTFRLPYDRCAVLYFSPGHSPNVPSSVPYRLRGIARHWLILAEECPGEGVLIASFIKPADRGHWGKQTWQAFVRFGGPTIDFSFDPSVALAPRGDLMFKSNEYRVLLSLGDLHRIMTHRGAMQSAPGGVKTSRVDVLRNSLDLPAVSRLRVINFDTPPSSLEPQEAGQRGVVIGSIKSPHFRRGTWRNLASGRRVPVRACAIHGGGDAPPPWYEVRSSGSPANP
jgi:hypothetical protein